MAKIGRNDPCPCGSGKKYKRCCLGKPVLIPGVVPAAAAPLLAAAPSASLESEAPLPPPYTMARAFESSEQFQRLRREHPQRAARHCTPGTLARLSTETLITRFARLGVDVSREAYLRLAERESSAWAIGEQWLAGIERSLSVYQENFVTLGACELWKRYLPERPSIEMLDEWMEDGYERLQDGDRAGACDRWLELWAQLRARLRPQMRRVADTASIFVGGEQIYNWVQDFVLELGNVARAEHRYAYAEQGRQLCEAVLEQFPDEDELFRINFRADLGEFLYLLGEEEAGERVMLELIDDHPDTAASYTRLAETLGYGPTPERGPIDIPRAIELLEQALARPVPDARQYDVEAHLRDLREHAQQHAADAAPSPAHRDTEPATKTANS